MQGTYFLSDPIGLLKAIRANKVEASVLIDLLDDEGYVAGGNLSAAWKDFLTPYLWDGKGNPEVGQLVRLKSNAGATFRVSSYEVDTGVFTGLNLSKNVQYIQHLSDLRSTLLTPREVEEHRMLIEWRRQGIDFSHDNFDSINKAWVMDYMTRTYL